MQPPSAQSQAFDAACSVWLGRWIDTIPLGLHRLLSDLRVPDSLLIDGRTKAALFDSLDLNGFWPGPQDWPNFYHITISIANAPACLAVLSFGPVINSTHRCTLEYLQRRYEAAARAPSGVSSRIRLSGAHECADFVGSWAKNFSPPFEQLAQPNVTFESWKTGLMQHSKRRGHSIPLRTMFRAKHRPEVSAAGSPVASASTAA